jgi:antitoxin YefM
MRVLNYDCNSNLEQIFDTVCENHEEVVINRDDNKNIVIISLEDYNSIIETNYLLSTKNNRDRILSSLSKAKSNKTFEKELIEE